MRYQTFLQIFFVAAVSCSAPDVAAAPGARPAYKIALRGRPEWNNMKDVRADLGPDVGISGRIVDLRGALVSGKFLKHPRHSQDESSLGVRIRIAGLTLKNGFLDDIPGGLMVQVPGVTLQNLTFTTAGEDFVSNVKDCSDGLRVIGCQFFNSQKGDKSIQANDARGLVVVGNLISRGTTAIRIQKKNAKKQGGRAIVEANRFMEMDTAINAAGKVTVVLRNNVFQSVSSKIKIDGSRVRINNG